MIYVGLVFCFFLYTKPRALKARCLLEVSKERNEQKNFCLIRNDTHYIQRGPCTRPADRWHCHHHCYPRTGCYLINTDLYSIKPEPSRSEFSRIRFSWPLYFPSRCIRLRCECIEGSIATLTATLGIVTLTLSRPVNDPRVCLTSSTSRDQLISSLAQINLVFFQKT